MFHLAKHKLFFSFLYNRLHVKTTFFYEVLWTIYIVLFLGPGSHERITKFRFQNMQDFQTESKDVYLKSEPLRSKGKELVELKETRNTKSK